VVAGKNYGRRGFSIADSERVSKHRLPTFLSSLL
jgi:hypothetical protein